MKKIYRSEKYKKYSKRRAKKQKKARLRYKSNKKRLNKLKYKKSKAVFRHARDWDVNIEAPKKFSFLKNPEQVIKFVNKVENCLMNRKKVFVLLSGVEEIDYDAIAVLFSVMNLFKSRGVKFNGDKPVNIDARNKLEDSGFFDELYKPRSNEVKYKYGEDNQIFSRANKKVESYLGRPITETASETIWGQKRVCKGLQRVLLELMHNTNNHAGGADKKGDEMWCISVNHKKDENKVEFVFVDYGIGIFNSLMHKDKGSKWYGFQDKMKEILGFSLTDETNNIIMKKLLEGEIHMTVTNQPFRGKGLPGIKQVLDRNQISNLFIISNNVFADISNNEYKTLSKNFSGTFIYWELCYSNVNQPWNIK